ncbi:MAG: PRC-barrel domain-containing protein [Beijerinckiaceae bacterium]|nr:PRC-barrel domain-containing protein [Beijerinckiaceae bacterium]MBX9760598.1 PRC-barrel domain-containing protein [Beijerinckiaceae bacterium]
MKRHAILAGSSLAAGLVVIAGLALAQQPAAPQTVAPAAPEASAPAPASAPRPSGTFVNERRTDQWLASALRGKNVYDRADARIGAINDLVIDRDGAVSAVVIGVGGFLGIGEKSVGVPFADVKISIRDGNEWLVLERSKDELKAAPDFNPAGERAAVRPAPSESRIEAGAAPATK